METFQMSHRGIGLWRDHGSDWTTYFPVAHKQYAPQGGATLLPHPPTLWFVARHEVKSATFEVSLANAHARFEGLQAVQGTKLSDGEYLLPIKTHAQSPSNSPIVAAQSPLVWGTLTIPPSRLGWAPHKTHIDMRYRGVDYPFRPSAAAFTCERSPGQALELIVEDYRTGTIVRYPIAGATDRGDVEVELFAMSPQDRIPNYKLETPFDFDFAANHLVATGSAATVTKFDMPQILVRHPSATDDHPCSGAYGCDPEDLNCP